MVSVGSCNDLVLQPGEVVDGYVAAPYGGLRDTPAPGGGAELASSELDTNVQKAQDDSAPAAGAAQSAGRSLASARALAGASGGTTGPLGDAYNQHLKSFDNNNYKASGPYGERIHFATPATMKITVQGIARFCNLSMLKMYSYENGVWDATPVTNQTATINADGSCTVAGQVTKTSLFGVLYDYRVLDVLPPVTAMHLDGPNYTDGSVLYISSSTNFTFTATDDKFVNGDGQGMVTHTYYAIDSDTPSVYGSPLNIPVQGQHVFKFYSMDNWGNVESTNTISVFTDNTAPVPTFLVGGDEINYGDYMEIGALSSVSLSATGVLPVAHIYYLLDKSPYSCSPTGFAGITPPCRVHVPIRFTARRLRWE
jgi:hypothetical protein